MEILKADFSNAKEGDKVTCLKYGHGSICRIVTNENNEVWLYILFKETLTEFAYCLEGRNNGVLNNTLFYHFEGQFPTVEACTRPSEEYDKSKFKIPHEKATFEEVLEASEMTKDQFMEFYDESRESKFKCRGFYYDSGFNKSENKCKSIMCSCCGLSSQNNTESWINGEDIWKPKMRERTVSEKLDYLKKLESELGEGEFIVSKFCDNSIGYFIANRGFALTHLKDNIYSLAILKADDSIEEFEIPGIEVE